MENTLYSWLLVSLTPEATVDKYTGDLCVTSQRVNVSMYLYITLRAILLMDLQSKTGPDDHF